MKLYVDRDGDAPSPRRVRIYLAEKGLDVPIERLELHVENRTPEFLTKNPVGTLPVLELDDGSCLSESIAICRYLEALHPEPPLFGSDSLEAARIEMWTRRIELYLYLPIDLAPHFGGIAPAAGEELRSWSRRCSRLLDRTLAERRFVAGDRYSIADAFALSAVDFGRLRCGYEIPTGCGNLARWHAAVSARPSASA